MKQPTRECTVCCEEVFLKDIAYFENIHHEICIKCFQKYLKQCISDGKMLDISCPHCFKRLKYNIIKFILPTDEFIRFRKFLKIQIISIDPLLKWCPNSLCSKQITLPQKFKRKVQCKSCEENMCTSCNESFHSGSCSSNFQNKIGKWEDHSNLKSCPACMTIVTKESGCNHITCRVCQFQWCWLCNTRYTSSHYDYYNPFGCPLMQNCDSKCEFYLRRFAQFLLLIAAIPLLLLFSSFYFIFRWIEKEVSPDCCERLFIYPLGIIVGLIVQPFVSVLIAITIIPVGVSFAIQGWIKDKEKWKYSRGYLNQNRALLGLGITKSDLDYIQV